MGVHKLAWVGAAVLLGCSGGPGSGFNDPDAGVGADAAVDPDATDPFKPQDGGADAIGTKQGCSGDLRNVIDENGVVLQTCPPDQGCAGGVCVPACDAAAASKGSVGCDYVVPTPSFYAGIKPPCFAVFVANNWPKDVKLTVYPDAGHDSWTPTYTNRDLYLWFLQHRRGQPEAAKPTAP